MYSDEGIQTVQYKYLMYADKQQENSNEGLPMTTVCQGECIDTAICTYRNSNLYIYGDRKLGTAQSPNKCSVRHWPSLFAVVQHPK